MEIFILLFNGYFLYFLKKKKMHPCILAIQFQTTTSTHREMHIAMLPRALAIRQALDAAAFLNVSILSYTAKYASALYGPFREALDSAPRSLPNVPCHKGSYQMDPANRREALREAAADEAEGADIMMVKPATLYLDVISALRQV